MFRKVAEKFSVYFAIKGAQKSLINTLLLREKDRMIQTCVKRNDTALRKFAEALLETPDHCFAKVIQTYYEKCCHRAIRDYFEWRQKTRQMKKDGCTDAKNGYHHPYLKIRLVHSLDFINWFDCMSDQEHINQQYAITQMLQEKYTYNLTHKKSATMHNSPL